MELTQAIASRRSIRNYQDNATVTADQVKELIAAAIQAPSWKNSQTGRYYVILSPEKMDEIARECLPEFNANNCVNAKALIVTAFETKRSGFTREGVAENELGDEWGAYDLGLANENLVLRARDLSLDTLIMGIRDGEKLRAKLDIPESQRIVSVISVGVRASDPEMPKRKAVDDITRFF
ncbi:MAG: nitroreductase family protein [Lachnospiraceae bacterium]|nr:nitroreductase family protein [Lachnospiraceae bacterium]MBR6238833.1 nitroreductase family protein [Lachnospiraceae bacterium]